MSDKGIIYKFTVSIKSAIETHYVRANNVEQARIELALHLNVEPNTLRHNNKNIPFKVREKIARGITEQDNNGRTVHYCITLDVSDKPVNDNTNNNRSSNGVTDTSNTNSNGSNVNNVDTDDNTHNDNPTVVNEGIRNQVKSEFDNSKTSYNTYRYDILRLFAEDAEIIRKYAGEPLQLSQTIDITIRKRAYSKLRNDLISSGQHIAPFNKGEYARIMTIKPNVNSVKYPTTLLDILDSYITNFNKPF